MGLPDSSEPIKIVIVGVTLETQSREINRQEPTTKEKSEKLDCLKDLDLFETMCKILNLPIKVKKIWTRRRLMPWFIANMTVWLYEYDKKHISKHSRLYSLYQTRIGSQAFERAFMTHRNAVTTAVKRTLKTIGFDDREKEETLKEKSIVKGDVVPPQQLLQ